MKEQFRRRRLPHWDKPGAIYFVTACLDGSIPAIGLKDIAEYRNGLSERERPTGLAVQEWKAKKWKLAFGRSEQWLDTKAAARHLAEEALASEVEQALRHFTAERYAIWSWVVMPSHFHWVFEPAADWVASLGQAASKRMPLERIMHSGKRHSARQCNILRGKTGRFWQDESYDHCVDNADELERVIDYVEWNPVKANLVKSREEYRFSSAYYRRQNCIPFGRPLIGKSEM